MGLDSWLATKYTTAVIPKCGHLTANSPTGSSWSREYRGCLGPAAARPGQFVLMRGVVKGTKNSYKEG
jgi:hypothetical protein